MKQSGFIPVLVLILIAFIVLFGGVFVAGNGLVPIQKLLQSMAKPSPTPQIACTEDAKLCPDGTSVGRVGPKCEFAPCPKSESISSADTSN